MASIQLYDDYGKPIKDPSWDKPYTADERKRVDKVLQLWQYGAKEYTNFFERQAQVRDFMSDKQWSPEEEAYFKNQNRSPLTINVMRPYANQLSGLHRTTRNEFKVEPVDQTHDPALAELGQAILKNVSYNNRLEIINAQVFNDQLCGKGDWHIAEDFIEDPLGSVICERIDPFGVVYDPDHVDPLMRDCGWLVRYQYMSVEDIKTRWSERVNSLKFDKDEHEEWWNDLNGMIPGWQASAGTVPLSINQQKYNGKYLVMDLEERTTKFGFWVLDGQGNRVKRFPFPPSQIGVFQAANPGYYVQKQKTRRITQSHIMPYAYTVLSEEETPYECYSYIPALSYRQGLKIPQCSSYNYSMLGLQRELNMRRSNQQEFLIRSLRGGYWVFSEGGNGQKLLTEMDENGHKIGKSYLVDGPPGSQPQPIIPPNIMAGLDYLEQGALGYFKLVTGFGAQPFGEADQAGESGYHRAQRREESQTTVFPIIDDFNHQMGLVAEAILERKVNQLDIPRTLRITGEDGTPEQIEITSEMIERLHDVRRFDVRIEDGPFLATKREKEQEERVILTELTLKINPQLIDPGDIWRGSNLPGAKEMGDKISERYLALMQPEPPTEEPGAMPGQKPEQPPAQAGVQ